MHSFQKIIWAFLLKEENAQMMKIEDDNESNNENNKDE